MENELLSIQTDISSGGITSLIMLKDNTRLNWVEGVKSFGTLYGNYSLIKVEQTADNEFVAHYLYKGLEVQVTRKLGQKGYVERYSFKNNTDKDLKFLRGDLGINTPFNDNYESANVCLDKKCHMHIWCGGNTAYVANKRMNGKGNNLGMILTKGSIDAYAITRAWDSNDRGDLSMLLSECEILSKESLEIEFVFFIYNNFDDFYKKAINSSSFLRIDADKYSLKVGEKTKVLLYTTYEGDINTNFGKAKVDLERNRYVEICFEEPGEYRLEVNYGSNTTFADFYVYSTIIKEIDNRINFIIDKQQITTNNHLDGAIMLYDNEREKTFVENHVWNDRNYARERICMLTSMIERMKYQFETEEYKEKVKHAINHGLKFIEKCIVRDNGNVYEKPRYKRIIFGDRLYNYSWFMNLYAQMFELTADKKYLYKAYNIAKVYYKKGGWKFYAINLPFSKLYNLCINAEYLSLAESYKKLFLRHGDNLIQIGINFPAHEVKYEQSIVAPSVDILLECYLISNDKKYLDEAETQLKLLEAFNGAQPSFHNNEIAIRHWDGFWFGKNKMYGDTFPHYWSCITAGVFSKYAKITGNNDYQIRANKTLCNNLCLIKNSRGSCAYLMPLYINNKKGEYYDPWANDQDWVMWFNMKYNTTLSD